MSKIEEIYDPDLEEVVGVLTHLDDGDVSITIGGSFVGVFRTFDIWNIGKGYVLRSDSQSSTDIFDRLERMDFDLDLEDSYDLDSYDDGDGDLFSFREDPTIIWPDE